MRKKIIKPKFGVNQKLWIADDIFNPKESKCQACEGKGTLILSDENKYNCPRCKGKKYEGSYVLTPRKLCVEKIYVSATVGSPSKPNILYRFTFVERRGSGCISDREYRERSEYEVFPIKKEVEAFIAKEKK